VYRGTLKPRAADGLAVTVDGEQLRVRCERAGVFELAVDTTDLDGRPITDAVDIGCIAPARIVATTWADGGRYLAGASTINVSVRWLGQRNGSEVDLIGALPVSVAPGETAIAFEKALFNDGYNNTAFRALHRATSPAIVSAGLRTTLPVEIVEPKWTLDIGWTHTGGRYNVLVRALDDHGRALDGLDCSITSQLGNVATPRAPRCKFDSLIDKNPAGRRHSDWTADKLCVTVRDQTVCKQVL
jgi:hypothetical protein